MRFSEYGSYKPTGIRWLTTAPAHWSVGRLKDGGTFVAGSAFPHDYQGDDQQELPFFKVGDLQHADAGRFMSWAPHTVSRQVASSLRAPIIPEGAIIWAKIGAALMLNRRRITSKDCCIDNNLTAYIPHYERITTRWAHYWTSILDFAECANPGAVPSLGEHYQSTLPLLLPPIDEQRAIADFLDHETARIDALIEEQQRLIELLQQKRQASLAVTVTQGLHRNGAASTKKIGWLTEVPAHWPAKRIKHLVTTLGGGTPSKDRAEFWNGDVPWASPKDMKKDHIDATGLQISQEAVKESSLPVIPSGSILIVVRGMILAHSIPVAMASREVTINQDMKGLQPGPEVTPEYLLYLLRGIRDALFQHIDSSAHGTRKIDWEEMGNMLVPVPPIEEQKVIVNRLESINEKIGELTLETTKGIDLLKERRAALIAAAVTGKIDVRDSRTLGSERVADWPKAAGKETPYG